MATPATVRSISNLIIEEVTDLLQNIVSDVQGTQHDGKITVTNGAILVTGADTAFLGLSAGDWIALQPDRYGYQGFGLIDTIANDNNLNLVAVYAGETATGNYVTLTNDEYLHANEYESLVDLRVYDPRREFEPGTPACEWWFASEEVVSDGEATEGVLGLTVDTQRASFRLMQMEAQEIIHDISRWLQASPSNTYFDRIMYMGFQEPIAFTDPDKREEHIITNYYFAVWFTRHAV